MLPPCDYATIQGGTLCVPSLTGRGELGYNIYMEENVITLIHTEVVSPKRRFIRSDGAFFALLCCGAFLIISLGNGAISALGATALYIQIAMYTLLLGGGYLVYRFRLQQMRYTLTDKGFYAAFATGKGERSAAEVALEDIFYVGPYDPDRLKKEGCGHGPRIWVGKLEDTLMLLYKEKGKRAALCISPGEELRKLLTEPFLEEQA